MLRLTLAQPGPSSVPASRPSVPFFESAVEDGPFQNQKSILAPVVGAQAAHQGHASQSRDCPPVVLGPLWDLAETPMLEPD